MCLWRSKWNLLSWKVHQKSFRWSIGYRGSFNQCGITVWGTRTMSCWHLWRKTSQIWHKLCKMLLRTWKQMDYRRWPMFNVPTKNFATMEWSLPTRSCWFQRKSFFNLFSVPICWISLDSNNKLKFLIWPFMTIHFSDVKNYQKNLQWLSIRIFILETIVLQSKSWDWNVPRRTCW